MFKVYKASAGAGKTTHLVIEYLKLCFRNVKNYRNILAITFTNSATAEMKERLLNILYTFAFENVEDFSFSVKMSYDKVKETCGLPDAQMRDTARELLQDILYDYDNFSISTIDSFFQRVLRAFAVELRLNLNFSVQVSLDELFKQTIDILLNRISKNNGLSERVIAAINQEMDESGGWNIEKRLTDYLNIIYSEDSYDAMMSLSQFNILQLESICKDYQTLTADKKKSVIELATEADALVKSNSDGYYDGKSRGIYGFFSKFITSPSSIPEHKTVKNGYEKRSFTKNGDASLDSQLCDYYDKVIAAAKEYKTHRVVCKNINMLLLMFDLKEIMDDIKQRDNLFYLSETNAKIFSEVKDEEAPYIYEKLGNRYAYFFIDEFQDTSKMQWENMMPLIRNALSQQAPHSSGHETGETILFGDVKQAIYRFRNGDARTFNDLSDEAGFRKMLYGEPRKGEGDYQNIPLDTNYRSAKNVIEFNNAFFAFLAGVPATSTQTAFPFATNYYQDVEQKVPDKANLRDGFVKIRFQSEDSEDYVQKSTLEAVEDAKRRGFSYRQMAVLSRSNDQSHSIARYLTENGIPVISSDSLLVAPAPRVKILVSVLEYVANYDDDLAKYKILSYLVNRKLLREDLSTLFLRQNEDSVLLEKNFLDLLKLAGIEMDRSSLLRLPFFPMLMAVCDMFGLNEEEDVFLNTFLSAVLKNFPNGNCALPHFFDWWSSVKSKLSLTSSENIDAVTISTIHHSKGLEYPVVIFPMRTMKNSMDRKFLWIENPDYDVEKKESLPFFLTESSKTVLTATCFSEEMEMEGDFSSLTRLNLLYVAHTRASEALYIITSQQKGNNLYASFIETRSAGETGIHFAQDEESPGVFWYGSRDYERKPDDVERLSQSTDVPKQEISKLNYSRFSMDSLLCEDSAQTDEIRRGLYVHDFLSRLSSFPENDSELSSVANAADDEYRDDVRTALRTLLSDEWRPFFAKNLKVLNETSIGTVENGKVKLYRPDRVVFMPDDSVMVIDYKTGKHLDAYEKQLQDYCRLLTEMGHQNVKYKIAYILENN